jgi:hypothetical protein
VFVLRIHGFSLWALILPGIGLLSNCLYFFFLSSTLRKIFNPEYGLAIRIRIIIRVFPVFLKNPAAVLLRYSWRFVLSSIRSFTSCAVQMILYTWYLQKFFTNITPHRVRAPVCYIGPIQSPYFSEKSFIFTLYTRAYPPPWGIVSYNCRLAVSFTILLRTGL